MNPDELQAAIFERLNHASVTATLSAAYGVTAIFNEWVPQVTDSGDPLGFPFVTMSFPTSSPYDDKTAIGQNTTVQVDVWARDNGNGIKVLGKSVYDRLHRQSLSVAGHIDTQSASMVYDRDPDGITRRCRMAFTVTSLGDNIAAPAPSLEDW